MYNPPFLPNVLLIAGIILPLEVVSAHCVGSFQLKCWMSFGEDWDMEAYSLISHNFVIHNNNEALLCKTLGDNADPIRIV